MEARFAHSCRTEIISDMDMCCSHNRSVLDSAVVMRRTSLQLLPIRCTTSSLKDGASCVDADEEAAEEEEYMSRSNVEQSFNLVCRIFLQYRLR